MRRLAAYTIFALLLTIAVGAAAWTIPDCEAVNYDHPDCDQYPTTTTTDNNPCDEYHETRHPECQTTTTAEVTTTTGQTTTTEGTTTTTPNETTTTGFTEQTTTTVQECVPPLVHQPPFCVPPTTTPTETVPAPTTPAGEEALPFTGTNYGMLAVSALGLLLVGGAMVRKADAA